MKSMKIQIRHRETGLSQWKYGLKSLWFLLSMLMGSFGWLSAQVIPQGTETQVNTSTANSQQNPAIEMDSSGNYLIVWESFGTDGSGFGIYGQGYDNTGSTVGSEFKVNANTNQDQRYPAVAMDQDGNSVVIWMEEVLDGDGWGIYGQLLDNTYAVNGSSFIINTTTTGHQKFPDVAMNSEGDFVVTWMSVAINGSTFEINAQRFNASGSAQGNEIIVDTASAFFKGYPEVAMNASGDFVITWQKAGLDGSGLGIAARQFNAAGTAQGNFFQVNTSTSANQQAPAIGMDTTGNFVIAWSSYGQDGDSEGIYAQRFSASASSLGGEFQVSTTTSGAQTEPQITMNREGGFTIAWSSYGQDSSFTGVYLQNYEGNGSSNGLEALVNTRTTDFQQFPALVQSKEQANLVVVWQDGLYNSTATQDGSNYGIYSQRYNTEINQAPVAACKNIAAIANANCLADISPAQLDDDSSDPDGDPISFQLIPAGPYSVGVHQVQFIVEDSEGGSDTCAATITVNDVTSPVPDLAILPTISGECSVSLTAPTATDNCIGSIVGTTSNPITYSIQGTYSVVWTYSDTSGNSINQTQTVIIDDMTAPVPNVATLPIISAECTASLIAPTAMDNCEGSITATTTDPLTYTTQGSHIVTWIYDDGNGNVSQQTQTVIIDDMTAPVPDVATLPLVTAECATSLTAPVATDNCEGSITATTADPLAFNTQGTHIVTWIYDDGNGNTSQQIQTVIIDDVSAPIPEISNLPIVTEECAASLIAPTAADNCVGSIIATTSDPLTYNTQGTFVVNWLYDDGNGNTSQQTQTVIVDDITDPVFTVCPGPQTVYTESGSCGGIVPDLLGMANAIDNCGAANITQNPAAGTSFGATHNDQITVTLTADDGNGNTSTCDVILTLVDNEYPFFTSCPNLIELCGEQAVNWPLPIASDNCDFSISSNYQPGDVFPVGTTTVVYTVVDLGGNQVNCSFDITIHDLPDVAIAQDPLPDFCQGLALLTASVTNQSNLLLPLNYSWSDGLGNETTALPSENGIYSIDITDARGCNGSNSISVNLTAADFTSAYTLIARNGINFRNSSLISGGAGVKRGNRTAKFKFGSVVQSFVKAPLIQIKTGSVVDSQIIGKADVDFPQFRKNPSPGNNDIIVQNGQTMTLNGSNYGLIKVKENATLIFDNPEIFIEEFITKDGASIEFLQNTELILDDNIKIGENNQFNLTGEKVIIYTEEGFIINNGSTFIGDVYAKENIIAKKATSNNPTLMHGLFISKEEIISRDYVEWNANPNCDLNFAPNVNSAPKKPLIAKNELSWNIYPNPASSYAMVEMPDLDEDVELIIYDQLGRKMYQRKVMAGESEVKLDVSGKYFKSVIYFVQIKGKGIQLTKRLQVLK